MQRYVSGSIEWQRATERAGATGQGGGREVGDMEIIPRRGGRVDEMWRFLIPSKVLRAGSIPLFFGRAVSSVMF
jgi:hypothetical protein